VICFLLSEGQMARISPYFPLSHGGRTKGGLNSKLHVVCDGAGKPLVMLLT
jgi:hypothetical protein